MDDIRTVMDAAESERAVLFGFDDGGALSAMFAASYPSRVSALILFGVWAKYARSPDYPWGWTEQQARSWWQVVEHHWGTEEFWRTDSSQVSPDISSDPDRVRAWARYARLSASPGAALEIEQMQRGTDIRALLGTVAVPTLVMHRTDDATERVEQAHFIGEQIAGAKVVELPGYEHAPFVGNVDLVLRELLAFVHSIRDEEAELDRILATILFTDVVASTERAAAVVIERGGIRRAAPQRHPRTACSLSRHRGRHRWGRVFRNLRWSARVLFDARVRSSSAVKPLGLGVRSACTPARSR
jgi:hypothetical protein